MAWQFRISVTPVRKALKASSDFLKNQEHTYFTDIHTDKIKHSHILSQPFHNHLRYEVQYEGPFSRIFVQTVSDLFVIFLEEIKHVLANMP